MKKLVICGLSLLLAVGMGGCASFTDAGETPEAGVLPEGYTVVYGKVKSAFGNEIVIVPGTLNEAGQSGGMTPGALDSASPPGGGTTSDGGQGASAGEDGGADMIRQRPQGGEAGMGGQSADAAADSAAGGGQDIPPAGAESDWSAARSSPQRDGAAGADSAAAASAETPQSNAASGRPGGAQAGGSRGGTVSLTYADEEATYLIPVTAEITTGEGDNARAIRFTQIAVKNIVKLTLDSEGVIVSLQIIG